VGLEAVDDPRLLGTGDHPQAPVVLGGIVQRDPHADERPVTRGDEALVLVPGLAREPRRLDEQHRLHGLDAPVPVGQVGAGDLAEDVADAGVLQRRQRDLADEVGEVDGQDLAEGLVVGGMAPELGRRVLHRVLAADELRRVLDDLRALVRPEQPRHDDVPLVDVVVGVSHARHCRDRRTRMEALLSNSGYRRGSAWGNAAAALDRGDR
jgi:hypothetical protein